MKISKIIFLGVVILLVLALGTYLYVTGETKVQEAVIESTGTSSTPTSFVISDSKKTTVGSSTLQAIRGLWAYDKNHIYYAGAIIQSADIGSFLLFDSPVTLSSGANGYFAKDRTRVYFEGKDISGADAESFETVGSGYAKDKNTVYQYQGDGIYVVGGVKPINCTSETLLKCLA